MPIALHGAGDMFLEVKGEKFGLIKGESSDHDKDFKERIEVLRWSWGIQARHQAGIPTGRATINDLKIVKRVDRASTGLMNALKTNEAVDAVLTLRKAGDRPLRYLKITIKSGRVTSLTVEGGDASGGSELLEHVSFSFGRITVEYVPQGPDGQALPAVSFEDMWSSNA